MKSLLTICTAAAVVILAGTSANAAMWTVPGDYATIQDAVDHAQDGDTIIVAPGYHAGATVSKAVEIRGEDGAVINSGPRPWDASAPPIGNFMAGFFFAGADDDGDGEPDGTGATINHLEFETVEFPVFSRGADDVSVQHCTMINPIQGITNWGGNRWDISHNVIVDLQTYNGGGIGILVGVPRAVQGVISSNIVSHNDISGILHVGAGDAGGYNGTGIVLYTDFRWGAAGPKEVTATNVCKNKVSLVSDASTIVDVAAIELTDTRDAAQLDPAIHDNAVGFNDLRGTVIQLILTPDNLDAVNDISRNMGDNRGHGEHPSAFGPGGI